MSRPETYLVILGLLVVLAMMDSYRNPADQVTSHLYVSGIHGYQAVGRPLLAGRVQCRYSPTCSEYSVEAVREHGIRRGLMMTVSRIESCTTDVPLGTHDPVPPTDSWRVRARHREAPVVSAADMTTEMQRREIER
jgi:hypothetical protein